MTETPGDLPTANEADAVEQAQSAAGDLDDTGEELAIDEPAEGGSAARWDADEADVLEQAKVVKPGGDEEYPGDDV